MLSRARHAPSICLRCQSRHLSPSLYRTRTVLPLRSSTSSRADRPRLLVTLPESSSPSQSPSTSSPPPPPSHKKRHGNDAWQELARFAQFRKVEVEKPANEVMRKLRHHDTPLSNDNNVDAILQRERLGRKASRSSSSSSSSSRYDDTGFWDEDNNTNYNDEDRDLDELIHPQSPYSESPVFKQSKTPQPNTFEESPRIYRRRARDIVALDPTRLGVESLGEPAQAIVAHGVGVKKVRPGRRATSLIETAAREAEEALARPLQARNRVTPIDEVVANLDELRPPLLFTTLPESQFRALARVLFQGFTVPQLQYYANTARQTGTVAPRPTTPDATDGALTSSSSSSSSPARRFGWIKSQQPWMPLKQFDLSADTVKEKLVQMIMMDRWALKIQEMIDGRGRLDVFVTDRILKLLIRGKKSTLSELTEQYLDQGDRIEVSKSKQCVTIIATRPRAENIVDMMDKIISRVRMRHVPASNVGSHVLGPAELEELGRITRSVVNYDSTGTKLSIAWMQPADTPAYLETPDQITLRLLSTASHRDSKTTRHLMTIEPLTPEEITDPETGEITTIPPITGDFVEDTHVGRGSVTSWRDSICHWSRWTLPLRRVNPDKPDPARNTATTATYYKTNLAAWVDRLLPLKRTRRPPSWDTTSWSAPKLSTAATFGHILHSTRSPNLPLPDIQTLLSSGPYPRIMSPIVPPPSVFSAWGLSLSTIPISTTLLLRFDVSPTHAAALSRPVSAFPSLDLTLVVADTDAKAVDWGTCQKELSAVLATHHADIMMPNEHVDVRLVQTSSAQCAPSTVAAMEKLGLFVNMSNLNLKAGTLITPHDVEIPIPTHMLTPPTRTTPTSGIAPDTAATAADTDPPHSVTNVTYNFAGLELHQSITTKCAGHTLLYKNIEAGYHGGRSARLALVASDKPESAPNYSRREYLAAVQNVARGAQFAWFQGVS